MLGHACPELIPWYIVMYNIISMKSNDKNETVTPCCFTRAVRVCHWHPICVTYLLLQTWPYNHQSKCMHVFGWQTRWRLCSTHLTISVRCQTPEVKHTAWTTYIYGRQITSQPALLWMLSTGTRRCWLKQHTHEHQERETQAIHHAQGEWQFWEVWEIHSDGSVLMTSTGECVCVCVCLAKCDY